MIVCNLSGCADRRVAHQDSQGSTIIAFGDSITAGREVAPQHRYPVQLSRMLGQKVINAGVSGNTSADALKRIERDVLEKDPRLVIVEFGANDAFQKMSAQETFDNIRLIIDKIHEQGAMVALATVKMGLFTDSYQRDLKRIAKEKRVIFIPDIMSGIVTDPSLKADQLHPNKDGYAIIAERIFKRIKPYL